MLKNKTKWKKASRETCGKKEEEIENCAVTCRATLGAKRQPYSAPEKGGGRMGKQLGHVTLSWAHVTLRLICLLNLQREPRGSV